MDVGPVAETCRQLGLDRRMSMFRGSHVARVSYHVELGSVTAMLVDI